jgi:hypothetical protein
MIPTAPMIRITIPAHSGSEDQRHRITQIGSPTFAVLLLLRKRTVTSPKGRAVIPQIGRLG